MTQGRVAQIINNANFSEINNLVSQGRDMDYIARHYHMDLALARPPRLKAKPMAGRPGRYVWKEKLTRKSSSE